ncbi:MAG TPA: class I SAM-dependent methyltransferase [Streptosporangiaceae bacterium]|nr:class I SAM-dependent methyltransferase [Streptosporangiaceae bacterium]
MSDTPKPRISAAPAASPVDGQRRLGRALPGERDAAGVGPNRFLVEKTADLVPETALDVTCGEGHNAIWLAEQGWRVTGVDFSPVGLAIAPLRSFLPESPGQPERAGIGRCPEPTPLQIGATHGTSYHRNRT